MAAAPDPAAVTAVAELLAAADSALFITGAGISADSGLPTYRGIGGLYDADTTEDGIPIEVAVSGAMMASNPALSWKYIAKVEEACRGATHNRGHEVIAALERRLARVCVLTQNVDGFHRTAGSTNVIEIHGNVRDLVCTGCGHREVVDDYAALTIPPACEACAGLVRPDVVLFGELLPMPKIAHLRAELAQGFDVVFTVGTTSVFPYIAEPVVSASRRGIPTVEINPGDTEVTGVVGVKVAAGAAATLDAIWRALGA